MAKREVVYEWPLCQLCMECRYGMPLFGDSPKYVCEAGCEYNTGASCPTFEERGEDEYDEQ